MSAAKSRRGVGLVSIAPSGTQSAGAIAPAHLTTRREIEANIVRKRVLAFFGDPENARRFEEWRGSR